MAITVASLAVNMAANTGAAESNIMNLARLLGPEGGLVVAGLAATAIIAGIGIASIKMAGDYQTGVTSLVTGAGESKKNIGMVSAAMLQMAMDTGTSTQQLIAGMYMVESAGYHGQAGLAILKAAAEGAKVGMADLGTVADATTTLMTDFGTQTHGAYGAVNLLVATVANGKTHMEDLATSLAQIAPTAAAAHVHLTDMLAAMATMTGEGVPAANAATYLRQTILALDAPSSGAAKMLKLVGLSSTQVATEMQKSLPGAIAMITEAVGKKFPAGSAEYVAALKAISGGSKTMQGMLDLSGSHLATFKENVVHVGGALSKTGNSVTGWSQVQGNFNQQMDKSRAAVEVLMIKLGQGLLPAVTQLVSAFNSNVLPVLIRFVDFLNSNSAGAQATRVALIALAIIVGGVMVGALIALSVAAWNAGIALLSVDWPIVLVVAAIAAVIAIIVVLVMYWPQIAGFFNNLGGIIVSWTVTAWNATVAFFQRMWTVISGALASWWGEFQKGLALIEGIIRAGFNRYVSIIELPIKLVVALFDWLFNHNYYFHNLVEFIRTEFERAKQLIPDIWNAITSWLSAAWQWILNDAQRAWQLVQEHIITPIRFAISLVMDVINMVIGWIRAAWAFIVADETAAWDRFVGIITGVIARVQSVATRIVSSVMGPITGLASTLFTAGQNLINMLIKGIESMAGNVANAASGIAKNIAKFLGFHSPAEQGPGADADKWMISLGGMLSATLAAQAPSVGKAASQVASALAAGIKGNTSAVAVSSAGAALSGLPSSSTPGLVSAQQNGQQLPIIINIDGKKVAQIVVQQMPTVLRNSTGTRSF